MRYARTTMLASALLIPLAGCNRMGTDAISACSVWRPISWSVKDTPQTVGEVKGSNARQAAFCK